MAQLHAIVSFADTQVPPIVTELEAIFAEIDDDVLLIKLRGPKRRGPKGYNPGILWRCYVAYYYLGLESVSDLIRYLQDSPHVAHVCGIVDNIPSQPTFSRFFSKLASAAFKAPVRDVSRDMTRRMFEEFPGFGDSVAIDSTPVKAWSNGGKKGKIKPARGKKKRGPKSRYKKVSDPEAGWIAKTDTQGKIKWTFGYKVHILCDTTYELPIAVDVTAGNIHDLTMASPLLRQARYTYGPFHPLYVLCDAAYSDKKLRRHIRRQYRAIPIIDPNPRHKKAVAEAEKIDDFKVIYGSQRGAVERLNGRLKSHRKLNHLRFRGLLKARIHAMMSTIVCQAQALATESCLQVRKVA